MQLQNINKNRRPLILIIDDTPSNLQLLGALLQEENCQLSMAGSGKIGLRLLDEINPDLIILDIMMPDINGFELCKIIKAMPEKKNIPIIFLSSMTGKEDIIKGFKYGGVDYITKPFDRELLLARINTHLELKFARETIENNANEISEINRRLIQLNFEKDKYLSYINNELASAAEYVKSLIPEPINNGKIKTAWKLIPSSKLGGDSFGYHWLDDDNFAMYFLDVSGHGITSSLQSISILNMLKFQTLPNIDFYNPGEVLGSLNNTFRMEVHSALFFTLFYGVYNTKTYNLVYSSGGHPQPLLISNQKEAIPVKPQNPPLGFLDNHTFKNTTIKLTNPVKMYIYSDGVYEINNNSNKWSINGLCNYLIKHSTENDFDIEELYIYVQKLNGNPNLKDDFSILKINFS